MTLSDVDREFLAQAGGAVVASTVVLTASFVGVVALLSGTAGDIGDRLPFYVLAMAVSFAGTIFVLDDPQTEGSRVIVATFGVAVACFVLVLLGAEGVVFAVRYPDRLLAEYLVVYFTAAGLIVTGLAFWALRHWREFAGENRTGL